MISAKGLLGNDPAELAEDFLVGQCSWDPGEVLGEQADWGLLRREADWTLRSWRDEFYEYRAGRYVPVSQSEMRRRVTRHLQQLNAIVTLSAEHEHVRITAQLVNNILLCLAATEGVHIPEDREINSWDDGPVACPRSRGHAPSDEGSHAYASVSMPPGAVTLSFTNGLVTFERGSTEGVLRHHTPRYFTFVKLPFDYDPAAECPDWRAFLDDVMDGDAERVELLAQWAGYLLAPTTSRQKFMLIAGEGGNGKTVFATIIERMVGEENVTHVQLAQFANQFALAATLGKVLNSTSESAGRLDELAETMLKSYTSGDRMTFSRKYREPISARPTAKVMISTNQLPQFADKSQGIWRRMLFVPFEKTYPEELQIPDLADLLSKELPGIFNWALAGAGSLTEQGRFIKPAHCRRSVEQYRRDVNPAREFLLDNYVVGFEYEGLPTQELYRSYVAWCEANGYRPLNESNFGKEVKRTMPGVSRTQRRVGVQRMTFYAGLAVREGSGVAGGHILDTPLCQ